MALLCYKCEGFGVSRNFFLALQGGLPLGSVPLGREGAGGRRQPICFVRGGCPKRKTKQKWGGRRQPKNLFGEVSPREGSPWGGSSLEGRGMEGAPPRRGPPRGRIPLAGRRAGAEGKSPWRVPLADGGGLAGRLPGWLPGRAGRQPARQQASQPGSQPARQAASQPGSQPARKPASQPARKAAI